MYSDYLPSDVGQAGSTTQKHQLGEFIRVRLTNRVRFAALYCTIATQSTTAATDIVAWDTTGQPTCTVSADTSAFQDEIVGLPITGGDATFTIGEFAWVQTWGNKIVLADNTAYGNNLLGDGSVANKESMMAHAATDGMVDTWATDAGKLIGIALEDDAPAITTYILFCFGGTY